MRRGWCDGKDKIEDSIKMSIIGGMGEEPDLDMFPSKLICMHKPTDAQITKVFDNALLLISQTCFDHFL